MNLRTADVVRIDHFRGFAAYWQVAATETTAIGGHWVPGPGVELFEKARAVHGELPIVAEDLGDIDEDVHALLERTGFPGMRILQFAFGELDSEYLPHRHIPNCVVYTGTHDNDTTRGWFAAADDGARAKAEEYLGTKGDTIEWDFIRAAYGSVADRAIAPLQDPLGLGSEARMNTPGQAADNWSWRVGREGLRPEIASRLRRLAELTGRLGAPTTPRAAAPT
jgi:4-alpha-glucanotransferase